MNPQTDASKKSPQNHRCPCTAPWNLLSTALPIVALAWAPLIGCGGNDNAGSSVKQEMEKERRDRVLKALSAIEKSSGQARIDARVRFYDFRSNLSVTPEDSDLLPRLDALLNSKDAGDVELAIRLICNVHHASSLPKLWRIITDPQHPFRGLAVDCTAAGYKDPKLVPILRDIIARDEPQRMDAVRALGYFTNDPAVVRYLHELLKDPKCVLYAKDVLRQANLPFDANEAVFAQMSYSQWSLGLSVDFPEDWPDEKRDGFAMFFRNEKIGAHYGVRVPAPTEGLTATQLIAAMEKEEHLKNELPGEANDDTKKRAEQTGAKDAVAGRYTLHRDGRDLVRRVVVLVEGEREIVIDGESPAESAKAFEAVFDKMWPTLRIAEHDPALIEQFTNAKIIAID